MGFDAKYYCPCCLQQSLKQHSRLYYECQDDEVCGWVFDERPPHWLEDEEECEMENGH